MEGLFFISFWFVCVRSWGKNVSFFLLRPIDERRRLVVKMSVVEVGVWKRGASSTPPADPKHRHCPPFCLALVGQSSETSKTHHPKKPRQ